MIYTTESIALVHENYLTINRGDIIAGFDPVNKAVIVLRIVKNERDF